MKKLLFTGLILLSAAAHAKVTVDFWNRTPQPLYFELGTEQYPPAGLAKFVNELTAFDPANKNILNRLKRAGAHFAGQAAGVNFSLYGDYAQVEDWDTSKKTAILLSKNKDIKKGDRVALITVNPNKDIYLVIDEDPKGMQLFEGDNKKYTIREQYGPKLSRVFGGAGVTERNLNRKNIATAADIKINPNYIVGEAVGQRPESDKEEMLHHAITRPAQTGMTDEEKNKRLAETLKGLKGTEFELED